MIIKNKHGTEKIISIYEDSEMTAQKAGKWVSENCTSGEKLQKLIDYIKSIN